MSAGRTWWSRQWLASVEQRAQLDPNRLPRARRYARRGTVDDLRIGPGEIRAVVAGRDARPYTVRVRVRAFTDAEWQQVLEAVATRAAFAADLHDARALSPEVATAVKEAGLDLVPGPAEIGPRCTCPDDADPCKHAAAVCYLVADALDADPSAVLLLRGRTRQEILAGLRALRREVSDLPGRGHGTAVSTVGPSGATHPPQRGVQPDPAWPARDPGVDAREVVAATASRPIPDPPAPPHRPGRPVAWPVDPPAQLAGLRSDLLALAADAARRAWELATGAAPDARLALDADADLARRADAVLGTSAFAPLAARAGIAERELVRWALAWRYGGPTGVDTLRGRRDPAGDGDGGSTLLLADARAALGGPATAVRMRGDRVTAAGRQLRLGRDQRWYPYQRVRRDWEPAGPASSDPVLAVARAWPHPIEPGPGGDDRTPR